MNNYSGDDIVIEEMPQGCVITSEKGTVVISSTADALAVIESLKLMLKYLGYKEEEIDD